MIDDFYTHLGFNCSSFILITHHVHVYNLLSDANDTAGRTGSSIASLLALLVAALAQVVGSGVADDGTL